MEESGKATDHVLSRREIERVRDLEDSGEKLVALGEMNITQAIEFVRFCGTEDAFRYLNNRLIFYKKLINGEEIDIKQESIDWNDEKKQFTTETISRKEKKTDVADPKTIEVGLWRDIYYAVMQGTPEMAAVKIATRRVNEQGIKTKKNIEGRVAKSGMSTSDKEFTKLKSRVMGSSPRSVVQFKGYDSGVRQGEIGVYGDLIALYKACEKEVQSKPTKQKDVDKWQIEHQAVLLMTQRLEGAFLYNGVINTSSSPYNAGITEAVTAGRLGGRVMHQMAGMRKKIQSTNFENIKRFIGKSGDNRDEHEKKRLDKLTGFLSDPNSHSNRGTFYYGNHKYEVSAQKGWKYTIHDILFGENEEAKEKQSKWFALETERLKNKFERSKTEVEKANLPEDERELQIQSVTARYQDATTKLQADYEAQILYLKNRTTEQLLADLQQRQKIVDKRYEKRKSLAQKALDLHFSFNHTPSEEARNDKPLAGVVDWINYAPLGVIKRSHKMMRSGIKEETVVEYALTDTIAGARGFTREDLKIVHSLVEKAKGQDQDARRKLEGMMKVGNIVSRLKYELPLEEIVEIASHNITGLEDSLRVFKLDETTTLLKQDVYLPTAVAVLENTRKFNHELPISQITSIAKNVNNVQDFIAGLQNLPLAEVETLVQEKITYQNFQLVQLALRKHKHSADFNASLLISREIGMNPFGGYNILDSALDVFSLTDVESVLAIGAPLGGLLEVRKSLEEKSVSPTIEEVISFTQYAGDFNRGQNVTQAIDAFGIDGARKIIAKSCRLGKALEVNNYMKNSDRNRDSLSAKTITEILTKGGIDAIIAIAKAKGVEVALKTIEAGFTVEEITRFPFLISPLVTKK